MKQLINKLKPLCKPTFLKIWNDVRFLVMYHVLRCSVTLRRRDNFSVCCHGDHGYHDNISEKLEREWFSLNYSSSGTILR